MSDRGVYEAVPVFPACDHGEAHKLVHFIVLLAWTGSPYWQDTRDFATIHEQALRDSGIDAAALDATSDTPAIICKRDVWVMPADRERDPSWGWTYLDRFCQFQADMSVISFRASQALRWKLAEFYAGVELRENLDHENLPKTLTEYRQFLTTSTEWAKEDAIIQRELVERERMIDERMREAANAKRIADEKAALEAARAAAREAAAAPPAAEAETKGAPKRSALPPDPADAFSEDIGDEAP